MYLAIIILPLLGSIVSGFFGRKAGVSGAQIIACTAVVTTTILAVLAFFEVGLNNIPVSMEVFRWIDSEALNVSWGFIFITNSLIGRSKFSYQNIHLNIGNVRWYSTRKYVQPNTQNTKGMFHKIGNYLKNPTFKRILVIFFVGLVSRSIVNYVNDINVFKEYSHTVSLVYYGFMAGFTGFVYEWPNISLHVFNFNLVKSAIKMFEGKFMVGDKMLSNNNIPSDIIKSDKKLLKDSLVSKMDAPNPQNGGDSNDGSDAGTLVNSVGTLTQIGRAEDRFIDYQTNVKRMYNNEFVNTNQMQYRSALEGADNPQEVQNKVKELADQIIQEKKDNVRIFGGDFQHDISRIRNSPNNTGQSEPIIEQLQEYYNDLVNTETGLKNDLLKGLKEEVDRLESQGHLSEDEAAEIYKDIERRNR